MRRSKRDLKKVLCYVAANSALTKIRSVADRILVSEDVETTVDIPAVKPLTPLEKSTEEVNINIITIVIGTYKSL